MHNKKKRFPVVEPLFCFFYSAKRAETVKNSGTISQSL
ncbi:hypothetical protein BAXH7_02104 [Bacillus amyloliquefaciens XH7]|nr:hypothetical protein LL3_01471 [Bacillus amyloliquefaciens LL3]AEK89236.1 hypothetical protein BAXH7_02104 [Bacillus amyloliquefaciens XH7]KYC94496.1 hypothetical protein B425_1407 [Bacillus amyloliquefaciens]